MRPGFALPDWDAPLNLAATLASVPESGTVKGMFIQRLLDEAKRQGRPFPGAKHYVPFKDYPLREQVRLTYEVATHLFPKVSAREALRRAGRRVYPAVRESLLGRVILGALARDFLSLAKLVSVAYERMSRAVRVHLLEYTSNSALFHFTGFAAFLDSYHVGTVEGGLDVYGNRGEVFVRLLGPSEAQLYCEWR
jgi:uncharacterized protein (TIGR02265 family)